MSASTMVRARVGSRIKSTAVLIVAGPVVIAISYAVAPLWVTILLGLGLISVWSPWVRHYTAGVLVTLALLVALWSFAAPRIEAQVGQWRDSAVGSAKATVTSSVPHLPDLHLPWGGNG